MIQVICGIKGSGKTKRIIDMANDRINPAHGAVIFIDDDNRYMFDLRHEVRFVNATDYSIESADMLLGCVGGIMASNFDISAIFIDGFLKLCKAPVETLGKFFEKLDDLSSRYKIDFVISVSGDPDIMPEFVTRYRI